MTHRSKGENWTAAHEHARRVVLRHSQPVTAGVPTKRPSNYGSSAPVRPSNYGAGGAVKARVMNTLGAAGVAVALHQSGWHSARGGES